MDNELHMKLASVAHNYGKTEDLNTYTRNSENCMYLNEEQRYLKFNHLADPKAAHKLVEEVMSVFTECGYNPKFEGSTHITQMLSLYVISF